MVNLWLEAESFKEKGGWVVDTASMENIHSAYLMAHGMGVPVEDAKTDFEIPGSGEYYIWSLTRDWTAVWNVKDPAGKYRIAIDNAELGNVLGTNGTDWAWQLAGKVTLDAGKHQIALRDLTGFNGRCDAILISTSPVNPDSSQEAIDRMRKELNYKEIKENPIIYDLVVVGGGMAGVCMALAAYRKGCKVALINDRPVLGGCNSSEIRVCLGGQIKHAPYEHIGELVQEISPIMGHPTVYKKEYFEDNRKLFAFQVPCENQGSYNILTNESVLEIEQAGDQITGVICTNTLTGQKTRVRGTLFADCSGDGIVARLGGAEVMYGTEAGNEFEESLAPVCHKKQVMGHSIRWYSEEMEDMSAFPDLDWNLQFDESSYLNCVSGDWEQETGFTRDMVKEIEYIRDYGLRAIYSNWSYQKNHCKEKDKFARRQLKWVSFSGGKRESYRVKGDYILTQKDYEEALMHEDDTARVTWGIDIHYPEPVHAETFGEAFRSFAYHRNMPVASPVPYRCLYSKDIPNLFLGGRLVSASHIAFSAMRVMRTLGMLGEVAGIAAAICKKYACMPREIYTSYLEELKEEMRNGVNVPAAFSCGGIGNGESYHFKDLGWWHIQDAIYKDNNDQMKQPDEGARKKFRYCVERLGLEHKWPIPEEWQ